MLQTPGSVGRSSGCPRLVPSQTWSTPYITNSDQNNQAPMPKLDGTRARTSCSDVSMIVKGQPKFDGLCSLLFNSQLPKSQIHHPLYST